MDPNNSEEPYTGNNSDGQQIIIIAVRRTTPNDESPKTPEDAQQR